MADGGDRVNRYWPLERYEPLDDDLVRCYERHDLHADGCTMIAIDLRTGEPDRNVSTVLRSYVMTRQEVLERFGISA